MWVKIPPIAGQDRLFQRTHTPLDPWTLIPADDKYYARVKVLQSVIQAIATALKSGSK